MLKGSDGGRKSGERDELFVGRRSDIETITGLLAPGIGKRRERIVTLTGEDGIGKTALAIAAMDYLARKNAFPGGIIQVDCERITAARGLTLAILKQLGVAEAEKMPHPVDALLEMMVNQEDDILLLLDSMDNLFNLGEGLNAARDLLREFIKSSSRLHLLTTCQRVLNMENDEFVFSVETMKPDEAAELFILFLPDMGIKTEISQMAEHQQIKSLKRILDLSMRLPLCLILNARRIGNSNDPGMQLKKAADDLARVMRRAEIRRFPERQQALRASLILSYDSLSDSAQELFARFSFFPGGLFSEHEDLWELIGDDWTKAAEELAQSGLARYDKLSRRYTMLRLVRNYAWERLGATQGDNFRRKAAEFWAEFARWHDLMMDVGPDMHDRATQLMVLPDDPVKKQERDLMESESFAALDEESENVAYAAEWALTAGDEAGLGIVDALEDYLTLSAQWYKQEQLYRLALEQRRHRADADPQEYLPDLATTLNNAAELLRKIQDFDAARLYLQEALDIYRRLSQTQPDSYMPSLATTLSNMGILLRDTEHLEEAFEHHKQALEIRTRLAKASPEVYSPVLATTLSNMGVILDDTERYDEALDCYHKSLRITKKLFERHPSAYAPKLLDILRSAMSLHKRLGMDENAASCEREMEQVIKTLN